MITEHSTITMTFNKDRRIRLWLSVRGWRKIGHYNSLNFVDLNPNAEIPKESIISPDVSMIFERVEAINEVIYQLKALKKVIKDPDKMDEVCKALNKHAKKVIAKAKKELESQPITKKWTYEGTEGTEGNWDITSAKAEMSVKEVAQ